ncbi:MAG: hypothetical protein AAFY02_16890 [Pseudomonadota bacterium]
MLCLRALALAALSGLLLLGACTSVPKGAADTNRAVSLGIERLKEQHVKTIQAFADLARQSVQQTWDYQILPETVTRVAGNRASLSRAEAMRIAGTALNVREELMDEIDANEQELLSAVEQEYGAVLSVNAVVTNYLASAEDLASARENLVQGGQSVADLFGFSDSPAFARILEIANNPIAAAESR